jgi:hypothetical protein
MTLVALVSLASIDDVSAGGWLTLVFPLVLVFIIAGLWWISLRHSRNN